MRNPNGYGCVVNLGKGRRKPFAVRISVGVDASNPDKVKNKYKYLGYFEKRKDAILYLANYNSGNAVKEHVALNTIPTFKSLYDKWIEEKKIGIKKVSKTTVDSYNAAFNRLKSIHGMRINTIKVDALQDVINKNVTASESTVRNIKIVLTSVFDYALARDYVDKNYAKLCNYSYTRSEPIHKPFSDEEIQILWENKNEQMSQVILIMIYTGLRIEEFLTIETKNIHLSERYFTGGIKTSAGKNRIIPIHKAIIPFLETFYDSTQKYLYHNKKGRKLTSNKVRSQFKEFTLSLLRTEHLPHDTRHTFATLADKYKLNDNITKKIIGHKIEDITKGLYTHYELSELITEIDKIGV